MAITAYTPSLNIVILASFAIWLIVFSLKWRRHRAKYANLPCPPHDFWWGHLKIIGIAQRELPKGFHYQQLMYYIGQKYNLPPVFYLDVWPLSNPLMMVHDPEVAYQIAQAKPLPKHPVNAKVLGSLVGDRSVVVAEGPEWRMLRSILNPGFSSQYLVTLVPSLVRHGQVFRQKIDNYAQSGEIFPIQETAMALTIDVIGEVVLGVDLDSQRQYNELATHFAKAVLWAGSSSDRIKWQLSRLPKWWHCRQQDRIIARIIRERHAEIRSSDGASTKAAVDLFLQAYRNEKMGSAKKTVASDRLDPEFMLLARNNVKTLLLGGHDTTSTAIAYTLALLFEPENHAELERLRAEHDAVFGPKAGDAASQLLSNPKLLNSIPLTTAAVKESLRLFPPASTTRVTTPSHPLQSVTYQDQTLPLAGQQIWVSHYGMGQRADLWPEPRKFKLDRFVPGSGADHQVKDAWRPFEKGPRGCLGLELAMMEVKIVLVLLLREFEFEIAYNEDAPRAPPEHGVAGGRGYQVIEFAAKPVGHMPMRASKRVVEYRGLPGPD